MKTIVELPDHKLLNLTIRYLLTNYPNIIDTKDKEETAERVYALDKEFASSKEDIHALHTVQFLNYIHDRMLASQGEFLIT